MKDRTFNTLFMLSSVDGKISTGDIDARDVDKDFPTIKGIKDGLYQYYALEQETDLYSFNTGRVLAKVGINKKNKGIKRLPVSFIVLDNTHLNKTGVQNLMKKSNRLFLVTSNKNHVAFQYKKDVEILYYPKRVNFRDLFRRLRKNYDIDAVTIQSGGTINALLLREGLIDQVSLVVAPALIGGKDTPTLIDGQSLRSEKDLKLIKALQLKECKVLQNSYLHLIYDLIH